MQRIALGLLASCLAVTAARADELPLVVWKGRVHRAPPRAPASPVAHAGTATVSHLLYLNPCLPDGCDLKPNFDSVQDRATSIAQSFVHISALRHPELYEPLVECVRATFAPFGIQVVTEDPGQVPHFETIVAGSAGELDPALAGVAGGVAPFIGCGATEDNVISFVFANQGGGLDYTCGAVAQEAAHVWGLSHELDPDDPMTYLELGSSKRFQNHDAACGESLDAPHSCECDGDTQNSFTYLRDTFGLADNLAPSVVQIRKPANGAHVEDAFSITGSFESPVTLNSFTATVDGVSVGTKERPLYIWTAPSGLGLGAHRIELTALDATEQTVTATSTVHVVPACVDGACPVGGLCLGGSCYGGPTTAGGLGATCVESTDCSSNVCGHKGELSLCAAACEADRSCPAGFECLNATDGVCWPVAPKGPGDEAADDGGCSTGGSSAGVLLGLLGLLGLASRRRPVPRSRS